MRPLLLSKNGTSFSVNGRVPAWRQCHCARRHSSDSATGRNSSSTRDGTSALVGVSSTTCGGGAVRSLRSVRSVIASRRRPALAASLCGATTGRAAASAPRRRASFMVACSLSVAPRAAPSLATCAWRGAEKDSHAGSAPQAYGGLAAQSRTSSRTALGARLDFIPGKALVCLGVFPSLLGGDAPIAVSLPASPGHVAGGLVAHRQTPQRRPPALKQVFVDGTRDARYLPAG